MLFPYAHFAIATNLCPRRSFSHPWPDIYAASLEERELVSSWVIWDVSRSNWIEPDWRIRQRYYVTIEKLRKEPTPSLFFELFPLNSFPLPPPREKPDKSYFHPATFNATASIEFNSKQVFRCTHIRCSAVLLVDGLGGRCGWGVERKRHDKQDPLIYNVIWI